MIDQQHPSSPRLVSGVLRDDFKVQATALALALSAGACISFGGLLAVYSLAVGAANVACGILCAVLLVRVLQGADAENSARAGCAVLTCLILAESYVIGGHESPVLVFLGPLIAAMALLISMRDAVVLTAVSLLAIGIYYLCGTIDLIPPSVMPGAAQSAFQALYGCAALGLIGLFVIVWSRRHRRLERMIDDIFGDLEAEAMAADYRARAAALSDAGLSSEEKISACVGLLAEALRLDAAHLWMIGPDGGPLETGAWHCAAGAPLPDAVAARDARVTLARHASRTVRATGPGILEPAMRATLAQVFVGDELLMWPVVVDARPIMLIECVGRVGSLTAPRTVELVRMVATQLDRVRERELARERIEDLAYRDAITGLPNRNAFETALERQLRECARADRHLALMFMDLDGFKRVNDALGHDIGDRLLGVIGRRLAKIVTDSDGEAIPTGDFVARLGGDEFTVVLTGTTSQSQLQQLAQRICAAVRDPVELDGRAIRVGVSIGTALYPRDANDVHDLIRLADSAMYAAKYSAAEEFAFASPQLNAVIERRAWIESLLPQAIERAELSLWYQPVVSTLNGSVIAHEALMRWQSEGGPIMPAEFIPVAESCGLVHRITEWNVVLACRQLAANRDTYGRDTAICLNVTPIELQQPGLVELVRATMQRYRITGGALEFEIAETHNVFTQEACGRVMEQLHEAGVHITIDHYGAGTASFANLRRLPIRRVKIDRVFADELDFGDGGQTIRRAVTSMAHSLGIDVTICGIENETQAREYRQLGSDALQGNWIGPPLPEPGFASPLETGPQGHDLVAALNGA